MLAGMRKRIYASDTERQKAYRERNLEKVRERERKWNEDNREKRNAISQAWRDRNPEKFKESYTKSHEKHKLARLARSRKWKKDNPEKVREYEEAHPEQRREIERRRRKAHPEKSITDGAIRRARTYKGKAAKFTAAELRARLSMYGGKCWICGGLADQVDHVIPLAKGGPHILANLRPACGRCNRRKGATHTKRSQATA